MDRFESQFEDLDVATGYYENATTSATAVGTPQEDVDRLMNQVADEAGVEQAQGDADVLGGDGQDFSRTTHRMVEVNALIPHRVPDGIGHGFDIAISTVDVSREPPVISPRAPVDGVPITGVAVSDVGA